MEYTKVLTYTKKAGFKRIIKSWESFSEAEFVDMFHDLISTIPLYKPDGVGDAYQTEQFKNFRYNVNKISESSKIISKRIELYKSHMHKNGTKPNIIK